MHYRVKESVLKKFHQINGKHLRWSIFLKKESGLTEAVVRRCSVKKVFLQISQNSQENTCARVSFLIKLQVFSCEFCEISKNTFFYRTPLPAAFGLRHATLLKETPTKVFSCEFCEVFKNNLFTELFFFADFFFFVIHAKKSYVFVQTLSC